VAVLRALAPCHRSDASPSDPAGGSTSCRTTDPEPSPALARRSRQPR
jgi:hypothetical protein